MKKINLIFLAISLFSAIFSYSQNWQWAKGFGGVGAEDRVSHVIDKEGKTYLKARCMKPTVYFQSDSFSVNGFDDMFLVKYDNSGNEVWTKQFGGPNSTMFPSVLYEYINSIYFDSVSNALYITGRYVTSCVFGSDTLNAAFYDDVQAFLAKIDLDGNVLWAKSIGGAGKDEGLNITTDQDGSVFITGMMDQSGFIDTASLPSGVFLANYDSAGNFFWAKRICSTAIINPLVNPLIISVYNSEIFLTLLNEEDTFMIDTMQFSLNNYYGAILSCFGNNGYIKWARVFGGPSVAIARVIADDMGNMYVGGVYYGGLATFDTDTLTSNANINFIFQNLMRLGIEYG